MQRKQESKTTGQGRAGILCMRPSSAVFALVCACSLLLSLGFPKAHTGNNYRFSHSTCSLQLRVTGPFGKAYSRRVWPGCMTTTLTLLVLMSSTGGKRDFFSGGKEGKRNCERSEQSQQFASAAREECSETTQG